MSYQLRQYPYHADIVETDTGRMAARVYVTDRQPYPVCDARGGFVFAVWELDEAIFEFEHSYTEPPWQPVFTNHSQQGMPQLFIKRTLFGELRVQTKFPDQWIALRDGGPLVRAGKTVTFNSCDASQAAAVKHARDYFYESTLTDGLYWAPCHVEIRDFVPEHVPLDDEELDRKIAELLGD